MSRHSNNKRTPQAGSKKSHVEVRLNKHSDYSAKLPKTYDEEDLFDRILPKHQNPLLLILDCVQDPHNLGACLRTANGAGVAAVIIPKDRSVSMTPTVQAISCGGADNTPLVRVTNLSRFLKKLQKNGIFLIGTADATDRNIYDTNLTGPSAILMGAEGKGLRRLTMDHCDELVRIPMQGKVPCLNVSVATGVCLYEALRQRQ